MGSLHKEDWFYLMGFMDTYDYIVGNNETELDDTYSIQEWIREIQIKRIQ